MSRRKIFFIAAAIVLIVSTLASAEAITLWNPNTDADTQEWYRTTFKPAFEAEHPGVTLELSFPSFSEFYDKLVVAAASGVAPDVVTSNNPLFYKEGLVIDLKQYIESWDMADDIPRPLLELMSYQGHIYGLPVTLAPRTFVVNNRLLAESGFDPENPPTTWEEIEDAVPRLTRWNAERTGLDQAGIHYDPSVWTWQGLFASNGVNVLNDDGTAGFSGPGGVETLEFWGDLFREYVPPGVHQLPFADGKVALDPYASPSTFGNIAQNNPELLDEISVAPRPVTNKTSPALVFAAPLGIAEASKNKELAWDLLAFHFRPDLLEQHNRHRGFIPPSRSALQSDLLSESPWFLDYLNIVDAHGISPWAYQSTHLQEVRGFLGNAVKAYYEGESNARPLLEEAARQWNAVVREDG